MLIADSAVGIPMIGDGKKCKRFSLLLDEELMAEAEKAGVNIESACEHGIRERIAGAIVWKEENREAMEAWNEWVREHGLPFAALRQF